MMNKPIEQRLQDKIVVQNNGCWHYTGALNREGYGVICYQTKSWYAHRLSYVVANGDIPNDLDLDHKCHDPKTCPGGKSCLHRRCINPDHIKPATRKENSSPDRAVSTARIAIAASVASRKARRFCPQGHEYTESNTILKKNGTKRDCRECSLIRQRAYNVKLAKLRSDEGITELQRRKRIPDSQRRASKLKLL